MKRLGHHGEADCADWNLPMVRTTLCEIWGEMAREKLLRQRVGQNDGGTPEILELGAKSCGDRKADAGSVDHGGGSRGARLRCAKLLGGSCIGLDGVLTSCVQSRGRLQL
jgi:hypothetical protein